MKPALEAPDFAIGKEAGRFAPDLEPGVSQPLIVEAGEAGEPPTLWDALSDCFAGAGWAGCGGVIVGERAIGGGEAAVASAVISVGEAGRQV